LGLRESFHDTCLLCGGKNPAGLQLEFEAGEDGAVLARFLCHPRFEGYRGFLHGGVAAALLDSAMTNCLFAQGTAALTAGLSVAYKKPVRCGRSAQVKAWLVRSYPPLHELKAQLSQDGEILVTAEAKFMETDLIGSHTKAV
jgi:uncharacterized protein (TIGR00369 family)